MVILAVDPERGFPMRKVGRQRSTDPNTVEVPDCVPLFIAREHTDGRKIIWIKSEDY